MSAWRKVEIIIAIVLIAVSVFFLTDALSNLIRIYPPYPVQHPGIVHFYDGPSFSELLVNSSAFIQLFLMVFLSGILLMFRNKYGWMGSVLSCFVIFFIIVIYALTYHGTFKAFFNNNLDAVVTAIISIVFGFLLINKGISGQYKTSFRNWIFPLIILILLFADWLVAYLIRISEITHEF